MQCLKFCKMTFTIYFIFTPLADIIFRPAAHQNISKLQEENEWLKIETDTC